MNFTPFSAACGTAAIRGEISSFTCAMYLSYSALARMRLMIRLSMRDTCT